MEPLSVSALWPEQTEASKTTSLFFSDVNSSSFHCKCFSCIASSGGLRLQFIFIQSANADLLGHTSKPSKQPTSYSQQNISAP